MRRLCTESTCTYSGRSVQLADCVTMEVELRATSKGMEYPSNPNVTEVAMGAGLRTTAKAAE
ncbi:putative sensor with HAMP domain [Methylocaldum marinum]|uniref:Putative sensor with HAMP domain n=1 Tax=Methylocaldum marinum TaxID=1432792 RepID=A0A250KQI5_9GAMM|nr:putative sensor with HAMP domain [Methylocaldum marinum]